MKAKGILVAGFLMMYLSIFGQDSLSISEIVIAAQRMRLGNIDTSKVIKPLPGLNDLPSNIGLLGGGVYRANGTSLSTISLRGGSTSQTALLWNNLPMQSPMLGLLDYNLLPANSYDVSLLSADASMWGSGAIAGVIALSAKAVDEQGLHGSLDILRGSNGLVQYLPKIYYKNGKFSISQTTDLLDQKNNYPYDLGNGTLDTLFNANVDIKNFQTDIKYKLTNNAQVSIHHWYQMAHRQLSPTAGTVFSNGVQGDTANRIKINFDLTHRLWHLNLGMGHFDESNVYSNPLAWSYGDNRFVSRIGDGSINYSGRKLKFLLGSSLISTDATSLNYREGRTENRWAMFYSVLYQFNGWQLNHKLRYEHAIQIGSPLLPAFTIGRDFRNWQFKIVINKVFRQPTLNDRYWSPGGNTALLPESGWAQEVNLAYVKQHNPTHFTSFKVNAYSRKIKNWIQWGREEPNPYFSALNLTEVHSKGIEFIANNKMTFGSLQWHQALRYDYTLSENQRAVSNPSFAIGEQLWYVPKHQVYVNSAVLYKRSFLWFNYKYASTMNGINRDIPAYDIFNAGLDYELNIISDLKSIIGISIFNVLNENYELTEGRPMMRRNANIHLKIKI